MSAALKLVTPVEKITISRLCVDEKTFSTEYELIKKIVTIPYIYKNAIDDGRLPPEFYEPSVHDGAVHLLACADSDPFALWSFYQVNRVLYECHTHVLPNGFGRRALLGGKASLNWIFSYTPANVVFGLTPVSNRLAVAFNKRMGAKKIGYIRQCCEMGGKLVDMIAMGITKDEFYNAKT